MVKSKYRLTLEVATSNDQLDWATIDDYDKRKIEEDGVVEVVYVGVKETE